jgi:hypothetical protein
VVEPRRFEETELKAPVIVVEPVTASAEEVASVIEAWRRVTRPVLEMVKSVELVPLLEVEPTAKRVEKIDVLAAWIENSENRGEVEAKSQEVEVAVVVPTPTAPL